MAQGYSTGPVHLYIGYFNSNSQIQYLGTGNRAPQQSFRSGWANLMADQAGAEHPYDWCYQGKIAFTSVQMARFNNAVLSSLLDRTKPFAGNPGFDDYNAIGSLLLTEGLAFTLFVVYQFTSGVYGAAKGAYSTLETGYRFPATLLIGPDEINEQGTVPYQPILSFVHGRIYNPSNGGFTLFDRNMTGITVPN